MGSQFQPLTVDHFQKRPGGGGGGGGGAGMHSEFIKVVWVCKYLWSNSSSLSEYKFFSYMYCKK